MKEKRLGNIYGYTGGSYPGMVYDKNGLCPTLNAMQGGNRQPMIVEKSNALLEHGLIYETEEGEKYRVRKLTPRECFRLMGVSDESIDKMLSVNSNSQCYKQAGNSIVVTVLMALFSQLGIEGVKKWNDMTDEEIIELINKSK